MNSTEEQLRAQLKTVEAEIESNRSKLSASEAAREKAEAELAALRGRVTDWIDMTVNCAGVPQNPDSLPQMLLHEFRAALKEGGES